MRGRMAVWGGVLVVSVMLGDAHRSWAQVPICPAPVPTDPYYTACFPNGRLPAARVLFDLTVDHVFKPDSTVLQRRVGDVVRTIVTDQTLDKNSAFRTYLDALAPIMFTKIDTATGTLQLPVDEGQRRFEGTLDLGDTPYPLTLQLPAKLSGGYWRTAGVLQIAFWEGQRATIGLGAPGANRIEADVECLVVSTDGIRVVTSGSTPDVLVRFEECGK